MMNREAINASLQKRFILLDADGREYNADNSDEIKEICGKYDVLDRFVQSEKGLHNAGQKPASIAAMQRLQLVDYEPASDSGHFRFYPKGSLIFDLIKDWAEEIALNRLNAMKIETPLFYSYDEPDIREQVQSFHERHYMVGVPGGDKEFILRFAGDFGLFRMMKDAKLSYRDLPLRLYEYSKSFRYEKSGELAGLKRLRAFSMPDIHSFTAGVEAGLQEFKEIYRNYHDLAGAMGIRFAIAFRVVEDFYHKYREDILELIRYGGCPVFIELLSDMKHYWAVKSEIQAVDSNNGFVQLSTVQLDVKDADIYGIRYTDRDGSSRGCTICHSSIGSIERWVYSILEAGLVKEKPELPYWLSPVQLRLIPVDDDCMAYCIELDEGLSRGNVRVDIDDSGERLGRKIKNAEQQWVPYTAVIGQEEKNSKAFNLRARSGENKNGIWLEEAVDFLAGQQSGMPFRRLNMNRMLSRQPIFRG